MNELGQRRDAQWINGRPPPCNAISLSLSLFLSLSLIRINRSGARRRRRRRRLAAIDRLAIRFEIDR